MKSVVLRRLLPVAMLWAVCSWMAAAEEHPEWKQPIAPFQIADNLYYVGGEDLAAFLITTPQGDILINTNLAGSEPMIEDSISKLGFNLRDVKIVLLSHAHFDHAGGAAAILQKAGAQYMVMDSDVAAVESGGRTDFALASVPGTSFPPAHVDRTLHDKDTVELGGTKLTANKTAGHTPGCTTWTFKTTLGGKPEDVVIVGSMTVLPRYRLTGSESYPGIAQDYANSFQTLRSLPCDIFLGSHGSFFHMRQKAARLAKGHRDAFVDPAGYREYVDQQQKAYESALKR